MGSKSKKKKAASILPTNLSPNWQKLPAVLPTGLSSTGTLKHLFSIQETTANIEDTKHTTAFPASFEAAAHILDTQATTVPPISATAPIEINVRKHDEKYLATKSEESFCHRPFWLPHENTKSWTRTKIHAPDLILPVPMASQVRWGSNFSLASYLQPTPELLF
jgi:hypothetical protein